MTLSQSPCLPIQRARCGDYMTAISWNGSFLSILGCLGEGRTCLNRCVSTRNEFYPGEYQTLTTASSAASSPVPDTHTPIPMLGVRANLHQHTHTAPSQICALFCILPQTSIPFSSTLPLKVSLNLTSPIKSVPWSLKHYLLYSPLL